MHETDREFDPLPLKQAVVFLIFRASDCKILLEKRINPGKSYSGRIIIPGGKVELDRNETFDQALFREVGEERGIKPTKMFNLDTYENISPKPTHYLVSAYLITEYTGEAKNVEPNKSEDIWVGIDEAVDILQFGAERYMILLARQKLINEGLLKG